MGVGNGVIPPLVNGLRADVQRARKGTRVPVERFDGPRLGDGVCCCHAPDGKPAYSQHASILTDCAVSALACTAVSTLAGTTGKLAYMGSTLAERIIEAREAADLDKAGLCRAVRPFRLTHAAVSQIESGKTLSLRAETALAIARATGFRPEYLVLGQLPKRAADAPAAPLSPSERATLDAWRAAPEPVQAAARQVLALAAPASAHTLQVAEPRPGDAGLDVALLQLVLREANTLPGIDASGVAEVAAQVYATLAASGQKPTRAAVIRLLRPA